MNNLILNQADEIYENKLRPKAIENFIGQKNLLEKLSITFEAAKERSESVDHILIGGQSGTGKTSCSRLLSSLYGSEMVDINAASIRNPADIAKIVCKLQKHQFLFIDEIHRLNILCQEQLYTVMEDFCVEIKSQDESVTRIPLNTFTLVGASTNIGKLAEPMRDRFGIRVEMDPYSKEELTKIVAESAKNLSYATTEDGCKAIANRSRGVPRIANRLLKRTRDFCQVNKIQTIDNKAVISAMTLEKIDEHGYTDIDHNYIKVICENYRGGPVGLSSISTTMKIDQQTVKDNVEPYLLQSGMIIMTKRGRHITEKGVGFYNKELRKKNAK